jgi:hypothetical protein
VRHTFKNVAPVKVITNGATCRIVTSGVTLVVVLCNASGEDKSKFGTSAFSVPVLSAREVDRSSIARPSAPTGDCLSVDSSATIINLDQNYLELQIMSLKLSFVGGLRNSPLARCNSPPHFRIRSLGLLCKSERQLFEGCD